VPSDNPLALDRIPLLAFYDGSTGELRTTTTFESPRNIAFFSEGSFWVMSVDPLAFNRIDSETHRVVQTIPVPVVEASGFNFDDNFIWATDLAEPRVVRIDKATGVPSEFDLADPEDETDTASALDIAVGDGSVWLSRPDREEITRLNAETGRVEARIPAVAFGLAFGEGALWYWVEDRLGRIDPGTNEPTFEELDLGTVGWLGNIYFGGGFAWTAEQDAGTLWRVDRLGNESAFGLSPGIAEMAATTDTIWVTNIHTSRLTGIDLVTGQINQVIDTGHATLAVAAGGDELMVAVGPTDDELVAALEGNVLKVSMPNVPFWEPSPDPALNGTYEARQVFYLTCVHLLNYSDEAAPNGWMLQPEVADGLPTISEDGRTYTFRIKSGFAFSPPSNEAVTAETFRATIERALSPVFDDNAPGPQTYSDIVGVAEYRQGTADHVSGIVDDGDFLTITLVEPSPTFLHRLALSWVCPVPIGTPALRSGLNPSPPVSGAGPYYFASQMLRRMVVLKKNPNYTGPRPQPFDAIAIRLRMASTTAIDHIDRGISDVAILPAFESLAGSQSTIAKEWGPGSANAEAGDQRWFGAPRLGVGYLAFNQTRGPFSDPDVRRAVALALHRTALTNIFVLTPTDDFYLPGMPGTPLPEQPVAESDVAAAIEIMDGRTFDVTMQGWPEEWGCTECRAFELEIVRQLSDIGITVTIRHGDDHPADAFEPDSGVDMIELGTGTEIPDLVSLIGGLRDDKWLGEDNIAELDGLEVLTGQERIDAATAFTERIVGEETLVVPYGHQTLPMFVSERIGCGFVQPAVGAIDLLSLCIEDAD
jgi:ABC-type transport system substrate-binding protein